MKPSPRLFMTCALLFFSVAAVAGSQSGHRSNISKPERVKIAQEAHVAETRAESEALKKYGSPAQTKQKTKMQQVLEERYYFQVCWRHKITHQQLVTIMSESLKTVPLSPQGSRKP